MPSILVKKWKDPETGLSCVIRENTMMGILLGYVGVKKNHDLHGKHYDDVSKTVEAHGGLTYSGYLENDKQWYFGFDCGHHNDYIPGLCSGNPINYKDEDYVENQCLLLAKQIKDK